MNPFYRSAIAAGTLRALVVKAYDDGKTSSPPANVVSHMLAASSTSTTATLVVVNMITGALYDTWLGRPSAGDANDQSVTRRKPTTGDQVASKKIVSQQQHKTDEYF